MEDNSTYFKRAQAFSNKEYIKWENKLERQNLKSHYKIISKLDDTQWQAFTLKWYGITSFNTNAWLAGAGNGVYYVPVTKIRYSKKVLALRFGSGADNWLDFYGYKGLKLAK